MNQKSCFHSNLWSRTGPLSQEYGQLEQRSSNRQDDQKVRKQTLRIPKSSGRKALPLRAPLTKSVYDFLMQLERPKHKSRHSRSRTRVAFTLLRFLGLRINEVATITLEQINHGLEHGTFQLVQPNTGKRRVLVLTPAARAQLHTLRPDLLEAFEGVPGKPLGSRTGSTELMRKDEWIQTRNEALRPAAKQFNLKITTHSFRANYITRLLTQAPIQDVKAIVGHNDIKTTDRYHRYLSDAKRESTLIDNALDQDDDKLLCA